MYNLSDTVTRKFIESYDITDYEIETDSGWVDITQLHKTIEYKEWVICTETGKKLVCADTHILFDDSFNEIFVKDCIPNSTKIITKDGPELVASVTETHQSSNMFDLTVAGDDHRYYTNDILSHNTTTAVVVILHFCIFNSHKLVALLANKGDTAREILSRIKLAYEALPFWLQQGVEEWNKGSVAFENGSTIMATSTSSSSIRGKSCLAGNTVVMLEDENGVFETTIKDSFNKNPTKIFSQGEFREFDGFRSMGLKETVTLKFKNSVEIRCTPDHEFLRDDLVWVKAEEMVPGDVFNGFGFIEIEYTGTVEEVFDAINVEKTSSFLANGLTAHNCAFLYIDETAFVDNYTEFFASVYPTISSGNTTKIFLTSTPNGLNHFYKTWQGAITGTNGYAHIAVPWWEVPGRDEAWKEETLKAMDYDYEKFEQEYCLGFLGSSGTLISGSKLKQLVMKTPLKISWLENVSMYEDRQEGHSYVCIADVSRGKGLDYSAFSIIDVTQMPFKQVCVFRDNTSPPVEYAETIQKMGRYYNNAQVLVEINDIGEQVSHSLYNDYEYDYLFFTGNNGRAGKTLSPGFGGSTDMGVRTTKTVKAVGCSLLKLLVEQDQLIINDADTISELSTFSKKGTSYEAESGCNDDLVMGLVLFAWMTGQKYFRELTDINTISELREQTEEQIMDSLSPFGLIYDGQTEELDDGYEVVDTYGREFLDNLGNDFLLYE